jgi:hypothetical protein
MGRPIFVHAGTGDSLYQPLLKRQGEQTRYRSTVLPSFFDFRVLCPGHKNIEDPAYSSFTVNCSENRPVYAVYIKRGPGAVFVAISFGAGAFVQNHNSASMSDYVRAPRNARAAPGAQTLIYYLVK